MENVIQNAILFNSLHSLPFSIPPVAPHAPSPNRQLMIIGDNVS